jgi:serine phosphatase RsbU (regulator of sigma subunit)
MQKLLLLTVLFLSFHFTGCTNRSGENAQVRFIVKTYKLPYHDTVWIAGNSKNLGDWKPGSIPLEKLSDSVWGKTFSIEKGKTCEFKITGASWWEEGLDRTGNRYTNFKSLITKDTTIEINIYGWLNRYSEGKLYLNAERYANGKPESQFDDDWLYCQGDNPEWAGIDCNDSNWQRTTSTIIWDKPGDPKWNGIGWFRFHMAIDSSLWNTSLAFYMNQLGASEVYYDGKLLYTYGKIGNSPETTILRQNRVWKSLRIDPRRDQVIAIRYANYDWKRQFSFGFAPGFLINLNDLNVTFLQQQRFIRNLDAQQIFYSSIPAILAVLHLLLFAFYRKQKQNLFYSICLLGFAGINFSAIQRFIETIPNSIIFYYQLDSVFAVIAIFFSLLTTYALLYIELPSRWLAYLALSIILTIGRILYPVQYFMGIIAYAYMVIIMLDIIWSFRHGDKKRSTGSWIVNIGFFLLGVSIIWQIFIDYNFLDPFYGIDQVWEFGMLSLAIAMSIFLSYDFSMINRNLEEQLVRVTELSTKTIEQERFAAKLELERQKINLENERKTKELESARALQLSLLPKRIPQSEKFEIACFMSTATEVGGDYYDFIKSEDELTIVVGDATGRGLKAGNMVIAMKGIMQTISGTKELNETMITANQAIKKMELPMLTMSLALLRIRENQADYSSAGMPPLLIYREATGSVERCVLKAMPLGAFYNFPYEQTSMPCSPGDIFLLMSDGLPESFNEKKDMFGIDRIAELLKESAAHSAEGIIHAISEGLAAWTGNANQEDDITIVVVRIK